MTRITGSPRFSSETVPVLNCPRRGLLLPEFAQGYKLSINTTITAMTNPGDTIYIQISYSESSLSSTFSRASFSACVRSFPNADLSFRSLNRSPNKLNCGRNIEVTFTNSSQTSTNLSRLSEGINLPEEVNCVHALGRDD
jgi:hypothetical protein